MQRTVTDYKVLLKEYDLDVDFIEDYGKVKSLYKTGVFALKEMANHQERNQNFIQKLQNVYQKGGWALSLFIKRSVLSPLFQMKAARIT